MSKEVHSHRIVDLRKRAAETSLERAHTMRLKLPIQRKPKLRTRRRKVRVILAFVAIIVGAGAVYGFGELTYLPKYSINEVSVEGAENISSRLVQAFVETKINDGNYHLISRGNIFLYPKEVIAKSVPGYFPRILSANISRDSMLAQAIKVRIEERKPFARWCADKMTCFEMDSSGFIFEPSTTSTSGEIVFIGELEGANPIGQVFLPEKFDGVFLLLSRLKEQGFSATSVLVESEQDFSISLAEFVLRVSFGQDANTLVRNLQLVLSSELLDGKRGSIEYIDLRFGNRVYYKNKASSQ
jgi:hypothetical protein